MSSLALLKLLKRTPFWILFWAILQIPGFSLVSAQTQAPALRFDHLTEEDGLGHPYVTALLKDQTGYLWIGRSFAAH